MANTALTIPRVCADAARIGAIRGQLNAAKAANGSWRSSRVWVGGYVSARFLRG
jgi:hypothetical protein